MLWTNSIGVSVVLAWFFPRFIRPADGIMATRVLEAQEVGWLLLWGGGVETRGG